MFKHGRGQIFTETMMEDRSHTPDRSISRFFDPYYSPLDEQYAHEHGSWAEYCMECAE